jgi:hypothetical protein
MYAIPKLDNDNKIDNLFKTTFESMQLNLSPGSPDYNKNILIKNLLNTTANKTAEKLDILVNYYNEKLGNEKANLIFRSLNIIMDKTNPSFSINCSNNNLTRSLEQASFYNNNNRVYVSKPIPVMTEPSFYDYESVTENNTVSIPYQSNPSFVHQSNPTIVHQSIPTLINQPESSVNYKPDASVNFKPESSIVQKPEYVPYENNVLETINNNLNIKLNVLEKELANVKSKSEIECDDRIKKVKTDLINQISDIKKESKLAIENYIKLLFDLLLKNQLITQNEIDNMNRQLTNNQIDVQTVINYLENKKKLAKNLNIRYNFEDILVKKWYAPLPRPPVCISDNPTKIKQDDQLLSYYSSIL